MTTPLVSRPRRVLARACYYAAASLAVIGFAMLFIAFNGNLWVISLLGALGVLIVGNAVGAPKSCRPTAADHGADATRAAPAASLTQQV